MRWNFVYAFAICSFAAVINLCAIGILRSNSKLKKSRFHTLVLYLSISDCFIAVQYIFHTLFNYLDEGAAVTLYGCMVFKHSLGGTIGFSEWQTLMICLERLQATFPHGKPLLKKLTSNRSVGISFVVCQLYTFLPLIYEMTQGPQPCHVSYTTKLTYVISLDVPLLSYYFMIVVLYIIVIWRIAQRNKRWTAEENSTNFARTKRRIDAMKRMKMNMLTLGIIITVTSLAILPRELSAIVSIFVDHNELLLQFVLIGNYATLLNSLIDPLIYVIRIKEVRDKVTCSARRNRVVPINISVQPYNRLNVPSSSTSARPFMSTSSQNAMNVIDL